jgi:hypothetical protein
MKSNHNLKQGIYVRVGNIFPMNYELYNENAQNYYLGSNTNRWNMLKIAQRDSFSKLSKCPRILKLDHFKDIYSWAFSRLYILAGSITSEIKIIERDNYIEFDFHNENWLFVACLAFQIL